jgi:hypothetical protein
MAGTTRFHDGNPGESDLKGMRFSHKNIHPNSGIDPTSEIK